MKKILLTFLILITGLLKSQTYQSEYTTTVTFPVGFSVGKFFDLAQVSPIAANSSGYYEISIAYTRGNIAAAATYIASISHSNKNIWKEAGVVNANDYAQANNRNFVIDVNGGLSKFRIRAIKTLGSADQALPVVIKIRSINFTTSFKAVSGTGSDTGVTKLQTMTDEWNLYVGNAASEESANIGIKVISNGNVGIGQQNPQNKLDVNGTIHAKEVKVDLTGWADYVFRTDYILPTLEEVERHIKEKGYLPNVPSEQEVLTKGVNLGDNQKLLLQKIEELTLYSIEQNKQIKTQSEKIKQLESENTQVKSLLERVEKLEKSKN